MIFLSKNQKIEIRVSQKQKDKIKTKAEKANMSMSEYLRKSALKRKIKVIETDNLHQLAVQVKKVGTNIWQIRKEIMDNSSFSATEKGEFQAQLEILNNQYQEVQNQIQKLSRRM